MLRSKSGLNTRHGITTTGTIDEGFSGSIVVNMQNHSDNDYFVQKGDKITQLLVVPCLYVDVVLADEIKGGERGANGFGSTGK
jgi:dUTP pyrophosphatase